MPKVYTQFDIPEKTPTPAGDKYLETFQEEIQKDGTILLVEIGKTNIYDRIQEDLESTKIENILKAMTLGDFSMLRQKEPVYIDATTFPKNLMECQNIVLKAKAEFEKMPTEVKELFNNSADMYVNEMGTKEFFEKMSPYNQKIADIEKAGNLKKYNEMVAKEAKFQKDVETAKGASEE